MRRTRNVQTAKDFSTHESRAQLNRHSALLCLIATISALQTHAVVHQGVPGVEQDTETFTHLKVAPYKVSEGRNNIVQDGLGIDRRLAGIRQPSQTLSEVNKREAGLSSVEDRAQGGAKSQQEYPTSQSQSSAERSAALSTETADTGSQAAGGVHENPGSLGSRIIGGLRGHLLEQQRTKSLGNAQSVQSSSLLGRKGIRGVSPVSDEDLDLNYEALDYDEEDDILGSWWPVGSHWQPPVKPFVEQRPMSKPGSLSQGRSAISDLASYLPGMRGKPGIPRIFHQVYLEGEEALAAAEAASEASEERWPPVKAAWRQRCKQLHPEWEFRLWNMSALEELLTQRYPWFVPTFEAYPQLIHKVDAVRPFIMHAFGGVYIDVDVECLQPVDGFLEDHELVFQEEDFGQKSLVNSAIAGVPGHHFWIVWQQVIYSRAPQLHKKRGLFSRSDFDVLAVLNATGPWALRAAFRAFSKDQGLLHTSYIGAWRINTTNIMVYPLGTWYVPCLWNNMQCHAKVEALTGQGSVPDWLAGHHKNAGSWFKAAGFSRSRPWWRGLYLLLAPLLLAALCAWLLRRHWRHEAGLEHGRLQFASTRARPRAKLKD